MQTLDFTVREAVSVSRMVVRLTLAPPSPCAYADAKTLQELSIRPGQFVEARIDHTPGVLLRRPISIHDVDEERNLLMLLVQRVGKGSEWLCQREAGDAVNLVLPLGNGFDISRSGQYPLLVGGGVGIAPLLLLGKELVRIGVSPTFLLGARSECDLPCLPSYQQVAHTLVCTEDGGLGEKGFVTQHPVLAAESFSHVYACGPKPMMQAVARYARAQGISCDVSLENRMACGLGACLCCVEDTVDGHVCVCKEGPVFSMDKLKW